MFLRSFGKAEERLQSGEHSSDHTNQSDDNLCPLRDVFIIQTSKDMSSTGTRSKADTGPCVPPRSFMTARLRPDAAPSGVISALTASAMSALKLQADAPRSPRLGSLP